MKDTKSIKVLNYEYSPVTLTGINRGYVLEAASDGRPASMLIPFDDLDYINSNTNIFRSGILTFEADEYDEVHQMLGNTDIKETSLSREQITDFILHPTYEKMQRILNVTDIATMERFRAELLRINVLGVEGVSGNVERIIKERYREVNRGVRKTAIALKHSGFPTRNESETQLQAQLDYLMKKVEELDALSDPESVASKSSSTPKPAPKKAPQKRTSAKSVKDKAE